MNSNTSLDRESFQMFLANAFEVHKSGLDPKSLSALVEVQRFIRRLRIGPNEVDYIAEDVTIRYFTSRPTRPKTRINANEVNISDDVTVR
jgi:hypothetical protein